MRQMECRGTTAVVMLALLSMTQAAWSAEPSKIGYQQRNVETPRDQRTRLRIDSPRNSVRFVIRDPAGRSLAKSAPENRGAVRPVNHEFFDVTPAQQQILVTQLGEDKARDALDALRSVTDDLDLDLPREPAGALPDRRPQTQIDIEPVESPSDTPTPGVNRTNSVLESLRAEQRKREIRSLLESVNKKDDDKTTLDLDLDRDLDGDEDDEEEDTDDSADDPDSDFDYEPANPEPIYGEDSNYEEIPWTISGLFEEPEDPNRAFLEQEFCRQMWACAGGRCLSPMERWQRDARRTYELRFGACPCSNPMPLMCGFIIEPMLGYGLFGAPLGESFNGGSCGTCGGSCHSCTCQGGSRGGAAPCTGRVIHGRQASCGRHHCSCGG